MTSRAGPGLGPFQHCSLISSPLWRPSHPYCVVCSRHSQILAGRRLMVFWPFLNILFSAPSVCLLQLIFLRRVWSLSSLCCQSRPHALASAQMPLLTRILSASSTLLFPWTLCLLLSFSVYHIPPLPGVHLLPPTGSQAPRGQAACVCFYLCFLPRGCKRGPLAGAAHRCSIWYCGPTPRCF